MRKQNVIESFAFLLSYFLERSMGDEDDAAVRDSLKTWADARIYHGDSRALLQKLPEAVMDLTDEDMRPQLVAEFNPPEGGETWRQKTPEEVAADMAAFFKPPPYELPAGGVWAHHTEDATQPPILGAGGDPIQP